MLSTDQKWVLGVLNSKLGWYILKSLCVVRNGGYIEVKPQFLEKFPIPVPKVQPIELEEKVAETVEKNRLLEILKQKFFTFIENEYGLTKMTKKLTLFYELSFKDFTTELKKQKILLTQQDKYELMDLFNAESEKIQRIKQRLLQLENETDQLVYELYQIDEKEKDLVQLYYVLDYFGRQQH